jgi:hypothetical protein
MSRQYKGQRPHPDDRRCFGAAEARTRARARNHHHEDCGCCCGCGCGWRIGQNIDHFKGGWTKNRSFWPVAAERVLITPAAGAGKLRSALESRTVQYSQYGENFPTVLYVRIAKRPLHNIHTHIIYNILYTYQVQHHHHGYITQLPVRWPVMLHGSEQVISAGERTACRHCRRTARLEIYRCTALRHTPRARAASAGSCSLSGTHLGLILRPWPTRHPWRRAWVRVPQAPAQ